MKTSLTHLPPDKRSYVQEVANIIIEEITKSKKGLAYLILFGGYARGDWVYERGYDIEEKHDYSYISDLDILIVTEKECEDNSAIIRKTKRKLSDLRNFSSSKLPDVSIIVHTVEYFNYMLSDNGYFFKDIKKEGKLLYDSGQYPMASPKKFTSAERKAKAIENYEEYFGRAEIFLARARSGPNDSVPDRNINAFMLHQACENAFVASSLVFKDDRRKFHDLNKLEKEVAPLEPTFLRSFPKETEREEYIFKLILKAYIDGRYKKYYQVTEEELAEMATMVKNFHKLVKKLCKEKIESFI